MPDGTVASPEILKSHQIPAAGKKGGKPQTEEEKQEERSKKEAAAKKQRKEFIGSRLQQKEILEEANSQQRAKIEAFQKKAKEKPIESWNEGELKKAAEEMFVLGYELHREGADKGLRDLVREYEYFLVDELYEKIGDEALRFYIKLLGGISQENDPLRKAWEEVNKGKTLSLDERRTQQMMIEHGIFPMSGEAPRIPETGITDFQLRLQERTANRLLEDIPDGNFQEQLQILEELRRSVSSLTGVDQAQQEQLLERVTERLVVVRRQIREEETARQAEQERREGGDRRRREADQRMGRNELPQELTYFKSQTLADFDLEQNTYTGGVRDIADRLSRELTSPNTDLRTETEVNSSRLNEYIDELSRIAGGADEQAAQAQKLLSKAQWLKEALRSQMDTDSSILHPGLYGEIRMGRDQQKQLIDNVLAADPDAAEGTEGWRKWQEVEKEFSRLFKYADVDSDHEWREAIGPGGDMEIRDFHNVLARAAENKILPSGNLLTPDQQEKVRRIERMLNREQTLREYLHTITYYVNRNFGAEDIIKAASRFAGEEAHIAFSKRGTASMLRLYEQAMLEVVAKNGGYLPARAMVNNPDGTYGEVEQLVLDMATKAKAMGVLPKDMDEWEIKRAISLARGMGIVTARFFEIAAMHGITKNVPLNSWWANGLVKNIAFFEQIVRFDVGGRQNAILGYKLEGNRGPWSTEELKRFKAMSSSEILDILVNDRGDDVLGQMKNPFHIGSIFTQTGWRWKGDKVTLASATARLLQYDENNPLIGVGLLIEAKRGELVGDDKNKAQQAEQVIRSAIGVAEKTTPLKFFNNLISLRQGVLRKHYKDQIKEEADSPGQIIITSKELQHDLAALALVQERLLRRRIDAYKKYLDSDELRNFNERLREFNERLARGEVKEKDRPQPKPPEQIENLHFPTGLENQDFALLKTAAVGTEEYRHQQEQEERVKALAEHIRGEFKEKHMDKLMHNLEHKGWKVPFIFGTDDMPHEAFDYAAITGDTIKRRWDADIGPVVATAGLYGKFIQNLTEYKSQGDIVKAMKEMHSTLSGHDKDVASEAMRYLAEGVAKFYKKDWVGRLPLGIGKFHGFVSGDASYAQVAFGRGQMAWDELDIQAFLHEVHAAGIVNEHQYEKLKKRLGAEWYHLGLAMSRSLIPMLIAAFIYMMLNEQLEQLKKAA